MKKLSLLLLFLLLPVWCWGATYYVIKDPLNSGKIRYLSGAWPAADGSNGTGNVDLSSATGLRGVLANGDTIILSGGPVGGAGLTYSGTEFAGTYNLYFAKNVTYRGCISTDTGYALHGGPVTLSGAGIASDVIEAPAASVTATISNLKISGAQTNKYGINNVATDNITLNDVTFENNWRHIKVTCPMTINRAVMTGSVSHSVELNNAAADLTINYSKVLDSGGIGIIDYQGKLTTNNIVVLGSQNEAVGVTTETSQVVALNNSIFGVANVTLSTTKYTLNNESASATCTGNNNLILYNQFGRARLTNGFTLTGTTNITNAVPKFRTARRPGIVSFVVDDAASSDNVQVLATLAEAYGYRITWVVDTNNMNAAKWAIAASLVARGHEIGSHSIDATTIEGNTEATVRDTYAAPSKAAIGAAIPGYTVRSFMFPGGRSDEAARAGVYDAGYTSARVGEGTGGDYLFSSYKAYDVQGWNMGNAFGLISESPTETQIRGRAAAIAEYLNYMGGHFSFVFHAGTEDYDMTAANAAYVFDVFKSSNVTVKTFGDATDYIAAHAETTSGTGGELVYERSESDLGDASDYRLRAGSPAINAGTSSVSGTVTLANTRLSLVSTAPFVDFSAAGTLTPYVGGYVTLTDSAGKTAKARILSAGTGETLGDEIITSWTNVAMETLTVSGTDITEATNSASTGSAVVADPIVGAGGLYKFVLGAYTLVSGADPAFRITNQSNAGSGGTDELVLAPPSASTSYRVLNGTRYAGYRFTASGSITASGHSLKRVTAPSVTGVVTSAWTVESGFSYNDAAGYTYLITDFLPTTDFLGKPIRGVPDIGAYEFQSVGGGLGMGIIY